MAERRDEGFTPAAAVVPAVAAKTGIARQGLTETSLERTGERAAAAQAAQAKAMIEARFVMARRFPRSWDDVRVKLLAACERPGFAGSTERGADNWGAAWFRKPVGDGIEGFSVRFAEEALRIMGNLAVEPLVVYDDEFSRVVNVLVIDLESNSSTSQSVTIEKTIERKKLPKGETALRVRVNSQGETLYILQATDDDVLGKANAVVSKARRTLILQHLPGHIQAECRKRLLEIRFGKAATDPDGERKKIADGFAKLNVHPADLEKYLEHSLAQCSPFELDHLRQLWEAVRDGKLTWAEILASKDAEDDEGDGAEAVKASGLDRLAEKLKASGAGKPKTVAAELFVFEPSGADPACPHPDVPEARLAPGGLAPGEEVECNECKRRWRLRKETDPKAPAAKDNGGAQRKLSDR
jgi:hypothetical protein